MSDAKPFAIVTADWHADGDALRLTRLYTPFDLGQLRLYPHFGRELAAYVGAEMERAALVTPRSGLVDQN